MSREIMDDIETIQDFFKSCWCIEDEKTGKEFYLHDPDKFNDAVQALKNLEAALKENA